MKKHYEFERYSADELGNIIGSRGKPLKPILHHTGYHVLTVNNKSVRWHRFVWECHNGKIPEGLVINHINGIKTDNRLSNLEVVTNSRNRKHAFELGLAEANHGENNYNSKITEEQCFELLKMCDEGFTNSEIAKKYNLHSRYVSLIRHGRRWNRVYKIHYGE